VLLGSRRPTYWEALGLFVHAFAETECILGILLRKRAEVPEHVGNAIFSGARIDTAMSYIRRIEEAKTNVRDIGSALSDAFIQLKIINDVRNDILHYSAQEGDDYERVVSTELTALTSKHVRQTSVSSETLLAMLSDLFRIRAVFLVAVAPFFAEGMPTLLTQEWRYKPNSAQPKGNDNGKTKATARPK